MNWFEQLMGFAECDPEQVRNNLVVSGTSLTSVVNGKTIEAGRLETPTLSELRARAHNGKPHPGRLQVRQQVANVQSLHTDPANTGALFQVASQFNLLEMVSPSVTPEQGVGGYELDRTQGPACAIAAGAGTIFRNYLVEVDGQQGQAANRQIDCLADIGKAMDNGRRQLWQMQNGYVVAEASKLEVIADHLAAMDETELDGLRDRLRTGLQWQTQVTLDNCQHRVSQAYCSALPIAYGSAQPQCWEQFARLILEGAYEATLCAALQNESETGNGRVYLTLLGGGAFGNPLSWVMQSIKRALLLFQHHPLDVVIVNHGRPRPEVAEMLTQL